MAAGRLNILCSAAICTIFFAIFANGKSIQEMADLSVAFGKDDPVEAPAARIKRTVNIPGYDPKVELVKFRNFHYLTYDEEYHVIDVQKDNKWQGNGVLLLRMETTQYYDNTTFYPGLDVSHFDWYEEALTNITRDAKLIFSSANDAAASEEKYNELIDLIEVLKIVRQGQQDDDGKEIFRVDVILYLKEGFTGKKVWESISRQFRTEGKWGALHVFNYAYGAYVQVQERTVFHATLRLTTQPYMPQFTDLNNTATLKITNSLTLLTRPMFRYCFGEFFFRSVVMEYFEGPLLGDTIVFMAFLLEENEYNGVDVDTVWKSQAATGKLGEYPFDQTSFEVAGVNFVPEYFEQFLIAEETRADRVLNSRETIINVLIPSGVGLLLTILMVVLCSWEGFFCRKVLENEPCCKRNDDESDTEDLVTDDELSNPKLNRLA